MQEDSGNLRMMSVDHVKNARRQRFSVVFEPCSHFMYTREAQNTIVTKSCLKAKESRIGFPKMSMKAAGKLSQGNSSTSMCVTTVLSTCFIPGSQTPHAERISVDA